jgi:hypothetical protein
MHFIRTKLHYKICVAKSCTVVTGDGTAGDANCHCLQQHFERSSEDWGFIRM